MRTEEEPESVCRFCGDPGPDHSDCDGFRAPAGQQLIRPRGGNTPLKTSQLPEPPPGWGWRRYKAWGGHLDCWFLQSAEDKYASVEVQSAPEWGRMKLVAMANGFEAREESLKAVAEALDKKGASK